MTSFYAKRIFRNTEKISGLHASFRVYWKQLLHLRDALFQSSQMQQWHTSLTSDTSSAIAAMKTLSKLLTQLDSRNNVLGMVLTNGFFLRDFFLIRRYRRWQRMYMDALPAWLEQLADIDACVSLANYQWNHPENQPATVYEEAGNTPRFVMEGLYHPFLAREKAVSNDFTLPMTHFAIVTGANMAGKSTFLRAVGINYVMAMNGLNVCASRFDVPVVSLFSSMRTSDNLSKNISYFNAELIRLEQLMSHCETHLHTLIILDEILKVTNSEYKLKGSRLFLKAFAQRPLTVLIATHDLALSALSDDNERFSNYCFEIDLGENVT